MLRKLFTIGALLFAADASAQVSTEITKDEFNTLLADKAIALNWNAIESLESKTETKSEDQYAVYSQYLTALRESELNNNATIALIILKEIEAVENFLNSSKK
jgi:arginyl-tRNA--protein-N-Asp/Glu arginylyltransferase